MAMDMDEQLFEEGDWVLQLQRGEGITMIPFKGEPFVVTDVFLVDPESAAGQGVVTTWVETGTRKIMLAELSSEITDVQLEDPVELDKEFRLYVARPGGDSDAHTDTDEDALVVQFEGLVLDTDTDEEDSEEENKEDDEEVASSEDDDGTIDEDSEEDQESDSEVDPDMARATSPGANAKDV